MRISREARDAARRAARGPRFALPAATPSLDIAFAVGGAGAALAGELPAIVAAGLAAVAVGAFRLGAISAPDPTARRRLAHLEAALVELGLTYGEDFPVGAAGPAGPAGPTDEPARAPISDIPRTPVRARPEDRGAGRGADDRVAAEARAAAAGTVERLAGIEDPPIGGPEQ